MTTFKISTVIDKPIHVVTEALMNPRNFPYWTTDLVKFEVVKGRPGEVGSVGRLYYLQDGRTYIMEDKLIHCEPKKEYVSQVSGDALIAEVKTELRAVDGKTMISVTWAGKGRVIFLKLFLPLLRGSLMRQSKAELEKFKKLVETRGSDFGIESEKSL